MQVDLIPGTVVLLIVFLFMLWAFQFHQKRVRLPPGPRPWLFLGNLLQRDVLPLFNTYTKAYSALPNIMNFLPGPHNKVFSDCKKICDFIRNKVDTHQKTLDPENPRDFIDCFLLKLEKEQNSSIICMEDLVMSVFQLFIGGTDTTSSIMSYAPVVLARFSDVQAKIQQEIDEIVGANRAPSMEDRMKLRYTNALVHEILRVLHITNENFPRMTTQDVNFRGHFIPQGRDHVQERHWLIWNSSCTILLQHFTFELIIDPEEIDLEALYLGCRKKGKYRYLRAIKREI